MFTQAVIRQLFTYDPATGILRWRIGRGRMLAGSQAGTNYYDHKTGAPHCRTVQINGGRYVEAHVIWLWMTGSWPNHDVDHTDVDPFNNSWSNLREASDSENSANRHNYRSGKLKWAYEHYGRYQASLRHAGKVHHIGTFDTEQEAHNAAYALAQQLHQQFTRQQ